MKQLSIFLLFISLSAFAQSYHLDDFNLKGNVKSTKLIYTYVNPKIHKNSKQYKSRNDVYMGRYFTFDVNGYLIADLADTRSTIDDAIDTMNVSIRTYNEKDRIEKKGLMDYTIPYPAYNFQKINYDIKVLYKIDKNDTNPEMLYYVYDYLVDQGGKIIKEISYNVIDDFEVYPIDTASVSQWTEYIYDKDLLVRQNIYPGKLNTLPFSGSYYVHYLFVPYSATSYRTFDYGDKNRLINVSFFINDFKAFEEMYTYHPDEGYITTVDRFVVLNPEYPDFPASKMKMTYNQYGDVTEVIYYPDGTENWPVHNRYYEYEYDTHHNWIKCKLFLLGDKNQATLIAERKIEYYKA